MILVNSHNIILVNFLQLVYKHVYYDLNMLYTGYSVYMGSRRPQDSV